MDGLRIGLMGLGHVGRQLYGLALAQSECEVVAVSDIGQPQILQHLLSKSLPKGMSVRLAGNYLEGKVEEGASSKTRLMAAERPEEIPWDLLGVDLVIDATGRFRSAEELAPHLDNGAGRVLLSTLPEGEVDRVVLGGVNDGEARSEDRIVSAGSASTTALALALRVLTDDRPIVHATMTTVHAYTGDQSLQDHAASDYRRSRSGARNIIPNDTLAPAWVECALPAVRGKLSGFALNVPVGEGSLLDLTVAYRQDAPSSDVVNGLFAAAAAADPRRFAVRARAPFPTHKHFVPRGMGQCPTLARRSAPCPSAMAFGRRAAVGVPGGIGLRVSFGDCVNRAGAVAERLAGQHGDGFAKAGARQAPNPSLPHPNVRRNRVTLRDGDVRNPPVACDPLRVVVWDELSVCRITALPVERRVTLVDQAPRGASASTTSSRAS